MRAAGPVAAFSRPIVEVSCGSIRRLLDFSRDYEHDPFVYVAMERPEPIYGWHDLEDMRKRANAPPSDCVARTDSEMKHIYEVPPTLKFIHLA